MEIFNTENLSFTYPLQEKKALDNITLSIQMGDFITLCGKSGCGKTTLLRLLKSSLSPHGELEGNIYFKNSPLKNIDFMEQSAKIGFVMQDPDNQIVTDKVWHELAFGLENLGYDTSQIRTKVSEMASFFGIENWFYKNVSELSGGQKQLLNLASVMATDPEVLILDEPTSQLDPIAAYEFLKTLEKINLELGTTIILSEHRLEDAIPISNRVIVLDSGKIIADSTPQKICDILKSQNHDMFLALPTPMRVYGAIENSLECPVTVRDGRVWLSEFSKTHTLNENVIPKSKTSTSKNKVIEIKDVYFRYKKDMPDVIKGLNIEINKGELFAILGGNGCGKTTLLSLISGLNSPYIGKVLINRQPISKIKNLYSGILGVIPQNPQTMFLKKTVYLDLLDTLLYKNLSQEENDLEIKNISKLCRIEKFLNRHPYDLSGGEQQRVALAKILLTNPEILLLDEPTKGFDAHFKKIFANIISELKRNGVTIVMVSHDIEFCAEFSDRCALMFDGNITSVNTPREFFSNNSFYTTSANRMSRTILQDAVLAEDIILACGGKIQK